MNTTQHDDSQQCAVYLKALADPTRLRIVRGLQAGPLSVSDLVLLLDLEMAVVSHHLRVLFHADIVETERDGKFIYYSLNRVLLCNQARLDSLDFGCCKLDMRET